MSIHYYHHHYNQTQHPAESVYRLLSPHPYLFSTCTSKNTYIMATCLQFHPPIFREIYMYSNKKRNPFLDLFIHVQLLCPSFPIIIIKMIILFFFFWLLWMLTTLCFFFTQKNDTHLNGLKFLFKADIFCPFFALHPHHPWRFFLLATPALLQWYSKLSFHMYNGSFSHEGLPKKEYLLLPFEITSLTAKRERKNMNWKWDFLFFLSTQHFSAIFKEKTKS